MCGSLAAPPTGTEPRLQPSASARPDAAAAPRSPADLETENTQRGMHVETEWTDI